MQTIDQQTTTIDVKQCFKNLYLTATTAEKKRLDQLAFGDQREGVAGDWALLDEILRLVGKYNLQGGDFIRRSLEGKHIWDVCQVQQVNVLGLPTQCSSEFDWLKWAKSLGWSNQTNKSFGFGSE